jgi:hypothetical protein
MIPRFIMFLSECLQESSQLPFPSMYQNVLESHNSLFPSLRLPSSSVKWAIVVEQCECTPTTKSAVVGVVQTESETTTCVCVCICAVSDHNRRCRTRESSRERVESVVLIPKNVDGTYDTFRCVACVCVCVCGSVLRSGGSFGAPNCAKCSPKPTNSDDNHIQLSLFSYRRMPPGPRSKNRTTTRAIRTTTTVAMVEMVMVAMVVVAVVVEIPPVVRKAVRVCVVIPITNQQQYHHHHHHQLLQPQPLHQFHPKEPPVIAN